MARTSGREAFGRHDSSRPVKNKSPAPSDWAFLAIPAQSASEPVLAQDPFAPALIQAPNSARSSIVMPVSLPSGMVWLVTAIG